jgi:hypothetical protein
VDLGIDKICNGKSLIVNGAIVTKQTPKFQRTIGGGKDNPATLINEVTMPAEIINYQPNLFLTPYVSDSDGGGVWKTDVISELPARY